MWLQFSLWLNVILVAFVIVMGAMLWYKEGQCPGGTKGGDK